MTQTRGRAAAPADQAAPTIPTPPPGADLPLERAFGALPSGYLTSAARQRLAAFARRADALGRLDPRTQEVYVDEKALRSLLRQLFPRSFEEECVAVLRAAPDGALRGPATAGDAEGRPLRWLA